MSASSKSAARKSRASTGKRTAQPQTPKSNGAETMTSAQRRSAAAKRAAAASVKPSTTRTATKRAARKSTAKPTPSTRTERKRQTRAAAPKPTETTPRVGAVADATYKRAADHATAIMRAIGSQRSSASGEYKRAGVSTGAAAHVHNVVKSNGGTVSAAVAVKLPTLAAYAAGVSDDADARAAVRDFAVTMLAIKRDKSGKPVTSRDAHGSAPVTGLRKLGGRKLAGLLVALAVDSDGWKPTGPAAKLIRETRPSK